MNILKKAWNKAKDFGTNLVQNGKTMAAPDMADANTSILNIFGAVLGVSVLIFGLAKVMVFLRK